VGTALREGLWVLEGPHHPHRRIAEDQVSPAPNPALARMSPFLILPSRTAPSSARGMDAADVFPYSDRFVTTRSVRWVHAREKQQEGTGWRYEGSGGEEACMPSRTARVGKAPMAGESEPVSSSPVSSSPLDSSSRSAQASMIRWLAWCMTSQSTSDFFTPDFSSADSMTWCGRKGRQRGRE
jgi:hypothetical protein